jgi:hypothetical protein
MKKTIAAIAIALALMGLASAQSQSIVIQQAVTTVPRIQAHMTDPDSFVLESVFTAKAGKGMLHKSPDAYAICYTFRSHNAMGGYGQPNVAVQYFGLPDKGWLGVHNGAIDFLGTVEEVQQSGWIGNHSCQVKNLEQDITAEVKAALSPSVPVVPPTSPEDAAKQAQQHADCLKAAVDNPSIVCK